MFAGFFETEAEARAALAAWARNVRDDWHLGEPQEVTRNPDTGPGGSWSAGIVAPVDRALVQGRPLRLLRQEARGLWARYGERYAGTSSAACEVCFPLEV